MLNDARDALARDACQLTLGLVGPLRGSTDPWNNNLLLRFIPGRKGQIYWYEAKGAEHSWFLTFSAELFYCFTPFIALHLISLDFKAYFFLVYF